VHISDSFLRLVPAFLDALFDNIASALCFTNYLGLDAVTPSIAIFFEVLLPPKSAIDHRLLWFNGCRPFI
jgi:hypothetical protein